MFSESFLPIMRWLSIACSNVVFSKSSSKNLNRVCIKCPTCVELRGEEKPEYPEKNPRSTGEINYEELNSHETQTRLGFFSDEKHYALTACAIHASRITVSTWLCAFIPKLLVWYIMSIQYYN